MVGRRAAARSDHGQIHPWLVGASADPDMPYPAGISGDAARSGDHLDLVQPITPAVPQTGRGRPDHGNTLPIRPVDCLLGTRVQVIGVHGGAGESRIAALDSTWMATGHVFPEASDSAGPALLCCRAHVPGLLAAQDAATHWAAGSVAWLRLLGLVIIADAPGSQPKPIRDLIHVIAGGVPRSWQLPWYEPWRLGEDPPPARLPRPFRRLAAQVDRLLEGDPDPSARPGETAILEGIPYAQH